MSEPQSNQIILPENVRKFLQDITWPVNPKFRIRNKAHPSGLYAIARKIVGIFNKGIDTDYITVINGQCWFPASYFDDHGNFNPAGLDVIRTLAHETVHEYDRKRLGTVPFTVLYLFPQILAALSLLAFLAPLSLHWLWCLLFLLFLAPIPAPGREYLEVRGYKTNISFARLRGTNIDRLAEWYVDKQFISAAYYFMTPPWRRASVEKRLTTLDHEAEDIYANIIEWRQNNS